MVRSLKNIANQASKKVKRSDVTAAAKARESMKASLSATEEKINSGELSGDALKAANNFRDSLKQNIKESYAIKSGEKRGQYLHSTNRMERTAAYAKEVASNGFSNENYRKNEMFRRDIAQASIGGVSTVTKEEVKIFYTMTREIWEGHSIETRNKMIVSALGVNTLEEAWEIVMSNPDAQKALESARKAQERAASDSDLVDGSGDVKDEAGSPPYIKELIVTRDTSRKSLYE